MFKGIVPGSVGSQCTHHKVSLHSTPLPLTGIWGFQFGAVENKTSLTVLVGFFGQHRHTFLLHMYPEVGLLCHRAGVCLLLVGNCQTVFQSGRASLQPV